MGNAGSTPPEDETQEENDATGGVGDAVDPYDPFDGVDTLGYRVLGVQPNSPASQSGLVSFLDFLVGANQRMLLGSGEDLHDGEEYDDVDLPSLLESYKDQPIEFLVYNIKSQESRLVELTPSDTWGGAGLIGVTIRLDNYAGADERLIRVLEVDHPQSPAAVAGLIPFQDYLLGTTTVTLDSTNTLANLLQLHQDRVLELYVYNCDTDVVRVVALLPTYNWSGPGLLGAAVGTGYLHRLPSRVCDTEGSSMERKVRYVDVNMRGNRNGGDGGPSNPRSASTPIPALTSMSGAVAHPGLTMLEVEPQLEMESDDYSQDASTSDMNSVALSVVDEVSTTPRSAMSAAGPTSRVVHVETVKDETERLYPYTHAEHPNPMTRENPLMEPVDIQPPLQQPSTALQPSSNRKDAHGGGGGGGGGELSDDRNPQSRSAEHVFSQPRQPYENAAVPTTDTSKAAPAARTVPSSATQPITYITPTSFTNVLPPPPKMHYHA